MDDRRRRAPAAPARAPHDRSAFGALLVGFDRTVYGASGVSIGPSCLPSGVLIVAMVAQRRQTISRMARLSERRANPNPNSVRAAATTATGRSNSSSDRHSGAKLSTATAPTPRSAGVPIRYSSGTSLSRGKPLSAATALLRKNFYQHAEHYLRVSSASREGNQPGTPRPNTPADAAISGTERGSSATDMERSPPGREDDQPGFI